MTGNGERECGIAKAHTIKIFWIGQPSMEVTQTHRNPLTHNGDGGRSTSIISGCENSMVYSNPLKYYESRGINDLGYTRVKGDTRYNDPKNQEIKERVSM